MLRDLDLGGFAKSGFFKAMFALYDSRLKTGMKRCHGVATKYLKNYLGWRRWLERWAQDHLPLVGLYAALGRENQFQRVTQT